MAHIWIPKGLTQYKKKMISLISLLFLQYSLIAKHFASTAEILNMQSLSHT